MTNKKSEQDIIPWEVKELSRLRAKLKLATDALNELSYCTNTCTVCDKVFKKVFEELNK